MKLLEYLKMYFKSLNPNLYDDLCRTRMIHVVKYFFFALTLSLVLMSIAAAPKFANTPDYLDSKFSEFQTFKVSGNYSADSKILFSEEPSVAVDMDGEKMRGELLLFTQEGIHYKKYGLFGSDFVSWSEVNNFKSSEKSPVLFLLIFLLPSLVFWLFIFFSLKYWLYILLFSTLAWLVSKSLSYEIEFSDCLKTGVFSVTPLMILELVLLFYIQLFWLSLGFYVLFFLLTVALVGERELTSSKNNSGKKRKKKKRSGADKEKKKGSSGKRMDSDSVIKGVNRKKKR